MQHDHDHRCTRCGCANGDCVGPAAAAEDRDGKAKTAPASLRAGRRKYLERPAAARRGVAPVGSRSRCHATTTTHTRARPSVRRPRASRTQPATMAAALRHGAHRHRPELLILPYNEQAKLNKAVPRGGTTGATAMIVFPLSSDDHASRTHAGQDIHVGGTPAIDFCIGARPALGALGDHDAYIRVLRRGPRRHRRPHVQSYYSRF